MPPLYAQLHSIDSVFFRCVSATTYSKDLFGVLNTFLSSRSYVAGFVASAKDAELCEAVAGVVLDVADLATNFPHVSRWWNHIASLRREGSLLVGQVSGCMLHAAS